MAGKVKNFQVYLNLNNMIISLSVHANSLVDAAQLDPKELVEDFLSKSSAEWVDGDPEISGVMEL